ncbi:MAG: MFS transporter [Verrucomicrobia bacterium]|nr:MFS transporter [Verrucomicrobiota bacterium]
MSWSKPLLYRSDSPWCLWIIGLNATLAATMVGVNLLGTIMVLRQLQGALAIGNTSTMWIGRIIFLPIVCVPPLAVKGANYFGDKKALFCGIFLFSLGAFGCTQAENYEPMFWWRVLTGVGQGMIYSFSLNELMRCVSDKQRKLLVSAYSSVSLGLGVGGGVLLGGWFGQMGYFRWIFWIQVWVGILNLLILVLFQPESARRPSRRFHITGYISFCLAVTGFLLVVTQAKAEWNTEGFRSFYIFFWLIVAVSSLVIFVISSASVKEPLFDLTYFRNMDFFIGCLGIFLLGMMVFGVTVVSIQMLEEVFLYERMRIAYLLAPIGISYLLFGSLSILVRRWIPPLFWVLPSLGLIAYSCWLSQGVTVQSDQWQIGRIIALRAAGVGLAIGPITLLAVHRFPKEVAQRGSVIVNTCRMLGATFGSATVGMIVSLRAPLHVDRFASMINPHSPAYQKQAAFLRTQMPGVISMKEYVFASVKGQAQLAALIDALYLLGWAMVGVMTLIALLMLYSMIPKQPKELGFGPRQSPEVR